MKYSTDKKTLKVSALLASADIAAFARVNDVLMQSSIADAEDGPMLTDLAGKLKEWAKLHLPPPKPSTTPLLDAAQPTPLLEGVETVEAGITPVRRKHRGETTA